MNAFTIGTSALAAGSRGLELVGQNVANATTPGYHRQAVNLVSTTANGRTGTGVDVASITRYDSPPARTAILGGNATQGALSARLAVRQQVEASLGSGTGGVGGRLESFFNQVGQLTARPDDSAARRPVLAAAADIAASLNTSAADIDHLRADVGGQVGQVVTEINTYAKQIADLNTRIAGVESRGDQANDLRDRRDQLVDSLSQRMDVRVVNQPFGVVNVMGTSGPVVVGEFASQFRAAPDPAGNLVVTAAGSTRPVAVESGTLGGLLQEHNQDIPAARARLDGLTRGLVAAVNQVQATGLGSGGPLTAATGTVGVADPTAPLAAAGLPFPIRAGQLVVGVTDTATGTRTNSTVAIDPATMSLQDVAGAITAATGGKVQATVDPVTNALRFAAQPGSKFDFAGRDTNPAAGAAAADPDTARVLSALGVNGLFTGSTATDIAVRPDIAANPGLLAASRTGQPGDGTNLERLAAVRDQALGGGRTLSGEFTDLAAAVGSDVQTLGDRQTAQAGVMRTLAAQEQSVAGVDVNEELVHLLNFQRMVEGAAKYLSVVNSALDSIMNIIR